MIVELVMGEKRCDLEYGGDLVCLFDISGSAHLSLVRLAMLSFHAAFVLHLPSHLSL